MIDKKALQIILSYTRRSVDKYNMIEDGDRIAVGVSGGKDSLTLLCALAALQKFYPKKFEVIPVTLKMGYENEDLSGIYALCDELSLKPQVMDTDIYKIVFDIRKEKNPCSLCARMRRGALHDFALSLGCKKLALGHHADDAIETLIMNLFIEGRVDCFKPVTYLSRKGITLIRPLICAPERDITHFTRVSGIKPAEKRCPADGFTKREQTKNAVSELEKSDRGIRARLYGAIERDLFSEITSSSED